MKIVIIGAGNVATVLGRIIKLAGHTVVEVVARHINHAKCWQKSLMQKQLQIFTSLQKMQKFTSLRYRTVQ